MAINTVTNHGNPGNRRGLVGLAVLVVVAASMAFAFGPVRGSRVTDPGIGVVELPDPQIAIDLFESRLETDPLNGANALILGQLYLDYGRQTGQDSEFKAGEIQLAHAVEQLPGSTGAKAALGSAYGSRHRFSESAAIGEELLAADPNSIEGLVLVGDAAMAVGDYERAGDVYERLLRLDRTPRELTRAAHLAEVTGDLQSAVELMGEAVALAERTTYAGEPLAWLYWRYGELHLHQGIEEPAAEFFEKALTALPEFPLPLNGLADIAARQGRYEDAALLFERSLDSAPSTDAFLGLSSVFDALGQTNDAEDRIDDAIALVTATTEGEQVLYDRDLARILADLGERPDAAVAMAAADIELRPDVFGFDVYAWALYRDGQYEKAREAANEALATGMKEPDFLYHSALIWRALGEGDFADADIAAATLIDPSLSWKLVLAPA